LADDDLVAGRLLASSNAQNPKQKDEKKISQILAASDSGIQ
jgi:hypothetical protein